MKKFEFKLIENESIERNPENPFKWDHNEKINVEACNVEDAASRVFFEKYNRDLNELMDWEPSGRGKTEVRYENSWDGSYLIFEVKEVK